MVVDGVARPVNTNLLPGGVEVVLWDSVQQQGMLQFDEGLTETVPFRDLEREAEINAELLAQNKKPLEDPIMGTQDIPMRPRIIIDFTPYEPLFQEWQAYVPVEVPHVIPPEVVAAQAEEDVARAETLGAVEPKTVTELKALSRNALRTWFDANFATDVQLRRVVRWCFMLLVRRFL